MFYCLAAVFLLTGIRLRDTVEQMLHKELICSDANERVKSLQRYMCVILHLLYYPDTQTDNIMLTPRGSCSNKMYSGMCYSVGLASLTVQNSNVVIIGCSLTNGH